MVMKLEEEKQLLIDDFFQKVKVKTPAIGDLLHLKRTKRFLLKHDKPEELEYIRSKIRETEQILQMKEEEIFQRKLRNLIVKIDEIHKHEKKSLGHRLMITLKEREKERHLSSEMFFK